MEQRLLQLCKQYAAGLSDKVAFISTAVKEARSLDTNAGLEGALKMAHQLHGSGMSFGFPRISDTAGQVEDALDALVAAPPTAQRWSQVSAALKGLVSTVERIEKDRRFEPALS